MVRKKVQAIDRISNTFVRTTYYIFTAALSPMKIGLWKVKEMKIYAPLPINPFQLRVAFENHW
jgi:hypothetical protein